MFQFTQLQLCVKTENIVIYGHDLAKLRFYPFGTCKFKRAKRKDSSSQMAHHTEGLSNNVLVYQTLSSLCLCQLLYLCLPFFFHTM